MRSLACVLFVYVLAAARSQSDLRSQDSKTQTHETEGSTAEIRFLTLQKTRGDIPADYDFENRMGVIGPSSTSLPPRFGPVQQTTIPHSGSELSPHFQHPFPLLPDSVYNIFSLQDAFGGAPLPIDAEERQFKVVDPLRLSREDDLSLKLKALAQAQATDGSSGGSSHECDVFITTEEFFIRSPNYPYNYPPNTTCEFQVYRRDADVCGVEFTVLRFDLAGPDPESGYCVDSFKIQDRPFCGRRQRGDKALVLFPGLLLKLQLETGAGYGASGLLIQGRQVSDCTQTRQLSRPLASPQQCVRSFRGDRFSIRSPGYPAPYPHNSECWFHVHKRNAEVCGVELIVEAFALEAASCMFDYVEAAHKRICGTKTTGTKYYFPFEDERLSIRFRSDESITRPGFMMSGRQLTCDEAATLKDSYNDPKTYMDFISATTSRKELLSAGLISNPSSTKGSLVPQDDDDIEYILSLASRGISQPSEDEKSRESLGRQLGQEASTESSDSATDLGVAVTSIINEPGNEVTVDTENTTPTTSTTTTTSSATEATLIPTTTSSTTAPSTSSPNTSPPNTVSVQTSTESGTDSATLTSSTDTSVINGVPTPTLSVMGNTISATSPGELGVCNEVFSGDSFTLRSPRITNDLPRPVDCTFFIERASRDVCEIRIMLMDMNLAKKTSKGECVTDYVQVAATKFCGGDEDEKISIGYPAPMVRLHLHSDDPSADTGFTARILQLRGDNCSSEEVQISSSVKCDMTITSEQAIIQSPHYPGYYPSDANCLIRVVKASPEIQSITLFLEDFYLEDSQQCAKDYFAVGSARICGPRSGEKISYKFPSDELELLFQSDGQRADRGYRIHVRQNKFQAPGPFQPVSSRPPPPTRPLPLPPYPPFSAIGVIVPSSSPHPFPGSWASSTLRPPPQIVPDASVPTISKCGDTTNQKIVSIKSPGYPEPPEQDLHCVYTIEKSSNDVCQLKIEIENLQMGSRIECGRSFLQVGSQQRLCGIRKNKEVRTYHFSENEMQLIFHSDPEGRDGGFHITVYQMQCGNFEPIGTFSGLHTATGPQIFTSPPQHGTSWTHPKQGGNGGIFAGGNIGDVGIHYVDPAPSRNSSQIGSDKQFINTSFGTSDTSVHYNGHEYDNYPDFVTDHKHHPQPQGHFDKDYHYVYYYLPQPTPQVVEVEGENKLPPSNQNQGKEKYDFFAMMKSKFKKMKDIFRKDYKKTRESGDAQVDVHYEKPEPRPQPQRKYRPTTTTTTYKPRPTRPLKITSQNVGYEGSNYQHRPYRYIFIRNPYYRPPEPGSYVRPTRFRYPQVYPQTQRPTTYVPTTQRPYTQTPYTQRPWSSQGARYPQHNAYIVVPSHQAHHVPQTGYLSVSPARPGFRPFWSTSGSSSYATTPVYTDSSRTPDYVITPTPIHPPTEQINQRPINFPPVHTTPRAISFPDIHVSPSSNVAGLATVRPFRPPTVLITATPPPFFGPTNSISSPRNNKAIPALIIPSSSSTSDHFEDFTDNFSGFSDISQLPLASESLVNTVTVSGCGRRIMEEEFHIDSSEALHHVSSKGPQLCTYHIAKSGADRCSLVLQVQDLQFNENCRNSSDARCSDEPSVHMLTSFAGNGDLSLQFNASSAETTTFTLYGRQIACGEKITAPTEVENGRTTVHNWEVVATASPGSRGWGSIKTKWVGPQGRGRETRTIIKQGGEGVSVLKPAVERW